MPWSRRLDGNFSFFFPPTFLVGLSLSLLSGYIHSRKCVSLHDPSFTYFSPHDVYDDADDGDEEMQMPVKNAEDPLLMLPLYEILCPYKTFFFPLYRVHSSTC